MRFEILLLIPITALVGCGEPTYEGCVRDAVEDGRSEYGIKVLTDLCDQAEQKKLLLSDKRCFAALTREYGEPAVKVYRDLLNGRTGECEFNADLSAGALEARARAPQKNAMDRLLDEIAKSK
jgi:hypothetical protein